MDQHAEDWRYLESLNDGQFADLTRQMLKNHDRFADAVGYGVFVTMLMLVGGPLNLFFQHSPRGLLVLWCVAAVCCAAAYAWWRHLAKLNRLRNKWVAELQKRGQQLS